MTEDSKTAPKADTVDDIPAGDSPKVPAWQLPAAAIAWGLWLVFLISMLWFRQYTPH